MLSHTAYELNVTASKSVTAEAVGVAFPTIEFLAGEATTTQ